ncbi:MAG TPA: SBBP repeat-containing protein, partial [Ferruginibacter sp.]|nr:SBBP repeat-containing protein [Ferruginibacter sp.]
MRKVFIIPLLLFLSLSLYAQNASFVWCKQFGGGGGSNGNAIAVDHDGNVYTIGEFKGTVDFDPGIGTYMMTASGAGTFVSKIDSNGVFKWAKQFAGPNVGGYAIALDAAGNVYTTGFFQYSADFDPGVNTFSLSTLSGPNAFVSKLDTDGNFVWAKKLGGTFNVYTTGFGIAIDANSNVYTVGQFDYNVDFDPGSGTNVLNSTGFEDI